jgi:hypothetical protein
MAYDKNVSPVGWYYGAYLMRFLELDDEEQKRNDPERRFLAWENTVIVKAESLDAAYAKVERIGKLDTKPYLGGAPPGKPVQWEYLGVVALLPIYEELEDGAEIAWTEHSSRKLKTLRRWVKPKAFFHQK